MQRLELLALLGRRIAGRGQHGEQVEVGAEPVPGAPGPPHDAL